MDLQHGCFSVKMYAKMKELGPVGGGVRPARPLDPPMFTVINSFMSIQMYYIINTRGYITNFPYHPVGHTSHT